MMLSSKVPRSSRVSFTAFGRLSLTANMNAVFWFLFSRIFFRSVDYHQVPTYYMTILCREHE